MLVVVEVKGAWLITVDVVIAFVVVIIEVFRDFSSTVIFWIVLTLLFLATTYRTVTILITISLLYLHYISSFFYTCLFCPYQEQTQTSSGTSYNCEMFHFAQDVYLFCPLKLLRLIQADQQLSLQRCQLVQIYPSLMMINKIIYKILKL